MFECLISSDPFGRVISQHFFQQIDSQTVQVEARALFELLFLPLWKWGFVILQLRHARPVIFIRSPKYSFINKFYLNILNNCSISLFPLNRVFLVTNSANIQPRDQISIGVEYSNDPNKISGALYQRVTTSWVYGLIGIEKVRASPKSAIFTVPLFNIKILAVFKSLWIIL
jgi:hypothetical protein